MSSGCVYTGGGGSTGALVDGCGRVIRCPGDWMVVIVEWLLVGGVNEIRVVRCWVLIKSRRPGCLRELLTQHSGEY